MSFNRGEDHPPDYETIDGHGSSPRVSRLLPRLSNESSQCVPTRSTGDVVLAWDGWAEPEPLPEPEHLPGMPNDSIMYTFSQVSSSAMVLSPPASLASLGPLYHITVAPGLFNGSATITTIREGGSEAGEFVADFQTAVAGTQPGTVCISRVLSNVPTSVDCLATRCPLGLGNWKFTGRKLAWEYSNDTETTERTNSCYFVFADQRILCAKFKPPHGAERHGRKGSAILDVTHQGHQILEQILVSALMIERIVTSPVIPGDK
ncbi:hypothetical protein PM082_008497 [Marasmius tenuissimus]|nr:hypothetical protein PM082_008497 [Marasmius tenuissimus]